MVILMMARRVIAAVREAALATMEARAILEVTAEARAMATTMVTVTPTATLTTIIRSSTMSLTTLILCQIILKYMI
jgi:hypothetical protein